MPFRNLRETRRLQRWQIYVVSAAAFLLLIPNAFLFHVPRQQFAYIGDFTLESGAIIRDAVVGYRTLGRLDGSHSNAVLVLPWFQGTSAQLALQIGRGKLVDSSKYFVIVVDVFGNGVSSSPSNSVLQPSTQFPSFTIADVVQSQYHLVRRTLQINHLHGVVGISMGGMQVFQWMTSYPDFVERAVSIVGSPQAQLDDRERCQGIIRSAREPIWPRARRALLDGAPWAAVAELRRKSDNEIRQAEAMASIDISRSFGGAMELAAAATRTRLLVVGTWQDREVNPSPAFKFAQAVGAEVLELDGRCGHQAPSCERETLWPAVGHFLAKPRHHSRR